MPDQNENMKNPNEEPREDQRRRAELSPETPEFGPPPGENGGMPDGDFPDKEFPDMEFPFMPGENPDYPLPTPSLPSMPPSGGGNGGRPNRPDRPNRPGGFPGGQWSPIAVYPIPVFPGNMPGGSNNRPSYCTIRFLNAAAGFDPVNISIGNKTVVHQVPYGEVTSYYTETTGFKQIIVTEAGRRGVVLARERFLFNDGDVYTIALVNGMNGISMVLVPDFPCRNQMRNFACIRAANLSYNAPAIDVVNRTGRIVFDDLRFKSVSAYRQFMEGQQMFLVTEAESGAEIFDLTEWVEPGKMYTLYVIGDAYVFPGLNGVFTEDYSMLAD